MSDKLNGMILLKNLQTCDTECLYDKKQQQQQQIYAGI